MNIELISESNNKYLFSVSNDSSYGSKDSLTIEVYAPNYNTAITRALQIIKSRESSQDDI